MLLDNLKSMKLMIYRKISSKNRFFMKKKKNCFSLLCFFLICCDQTAIKYVGSYVVSRNKKIWNFTKSKILYLISFFYDRDGFCRLSFARKSCDRIFTHLAGSWSAQIFRTAQCCMTIAFLIISGSAHSLFT